MTTLPLSLTIVNDLDRLENFLKLMGLDVISGGITVRGLLCQLGWNSREAHVAVTNSIFNGWILFLQGCDQCSRPLTRAKVSPSMAMGKGKWATYVNIYMYRDNCGYSISNNKSNNDG